MHQDKPILTHSHNVSQHQWSREVPENLPCTASSFTTPENRTVSPGPDDAMRMITEKRRNEVLATVTRDGSVAVNDLARLLGVSTETIRNDIRFWEKKGVLRKTHGGAALLNVADALTNINKRMAEHVDAKNAIAARALEMIPERATVFLDCGSTTVCAARQLSVRGGLTIVTPSLMVAHELAASGNKVMLLGGVLSQDSMGTFGLWTTGALKSIRIDVALLDSSGIKGFDGPVVNDFADAEVKGVVVERSNFKIVLADSSKFANSGLVEYCGWGDIDVFVTNADADPGQCAELAKATKLVLV